jgi:hypothetical protein
VTMSGFKNVLRLKLEAKEVVRISTYTILYLLCIAYLGRGHVPEEGGLLERSKALKMRTRTSEDLRCML